MINTQEIREKFFSDPAWHDVEQLLMDYVNPLIEFSDVDLTQPAEHVKAEIIGRKKLYEQVVAFLESTGMVANPRNYQKTNQFK